MKHRNTAAKPGPSASWRDMLTARPVRNHAADVTLDGDTLSVSVPLRRPGFLVPPLSWIVRPGAARRLVLDTLGKQVWEQCDGQRTVEQIVDAMSEAHDLTFHEARVATTNYLKQLVERGALAIVTAGAEDNNERL